MARPRIREDIVDAIKAIWAEDTTQYASEVWEKIKAINGGRTPAPASLRKVQQIVADARATFPGRVYPLVEWLPWRNEAESHVYAAHLLRLDAISMATSGRHLYQHEAKWGRRTRTAVQDLSPWLQYVIALAYASREVAAYSLGERRPYTADLDGILAYRPWISGNEDAYQHAILGTAVPVPLAFGREEAQRFLDAMKNVGGEEDHRDVAWYLEQTSYWNVARKMFAQIPRKAVHVDRAKQPFIGHMLDSVLDAWAGEKPEIFQDDEAKLEEENHERTNPKPGQE